MQKINFEDATLVTQAKVTVGGTDYEVTPATYSGGTDLDADTLNDLQDNVEASFKNSYSESTSDGYACDYVNGKTGEILWSGTATANQITLNKATTGYSYVEIYGFATDGSSATGNRVFAKVDNPTDCAFYLSGYDIDTVNAVLYLKAATCVINNAGTKITIASNYQWWQIAGSNTGAGSTGNYIKIYKVVGYK